MPLAPPSTEGMTNPSTTGDAGSDDEIQKLKANLAREKAAKRKMYSYLVKIADELKTLRSESEQLIKTAEYARKAWYEGGMWRGPKILPGAGGMGSSGGSVEMQGGNTAGAANPGTNSGANTGPAGTSIVPRAPVSLSDLFLDLVTVTAFSRVGSAIQDRGIVDAPILAYFAIFWQIWSKEASYSTRFDTTDISSHIETLLACFALLGGSLSAYSDFYSAGCDRIMGVAMFVALLHVALHARVWYWFKDGGEADTVNYAVKKYALFVMMMNSLEAMTWVVGMSLHQENTWRPWVVLVGILLNFRLPQAFMPNDFHGEYHCLCTFFFFLNS